MGNGCSRKTAVIEPMELPDKPKRLSPSIENLVESIIAERMEVHHQGIKILKLSSNKLFKLFEMS